MRGGPSAGLCHARGVRGRSACIGLAGAALAAAGGLAVALWLASGSALRPAWYVHRTPEQGLQPRDGDPFAADFWQGVHHDPGADFGYAFEEVEFPAVDGSALRGWYVPGAARASVGLVAVHGGGADRREFLRHLPLFHEAGYPVLLFDCREHGVSDGASRGLSFGAREHEDVSSAVAYLAGPRGIARVAVIGTSQGAASAILAAADDPRIAAVVAENPFTHLRDLLLDTSLAAGVPRPFRVLLARVIEWRLGGARPGPIDVVGRIAPRPLLLMHGTADSVIPYAQSQRLFAAAGEPKELWLVPGARHAALVNEDPMGWREHVLGFLERSLGEVSQPAAAAARRQR